MSLIIFESNNLDGLRPFSFNHSPIELRVGAFTNLERLQCLYKDEDIILIKVIGIRFELNDETISVLGELKQQKQRLTKIKVEE